MANKAQKRRRRWVNVILFMLVSSVLFINSFTDLLNKFNIFIQVQWIAWIALIGITGYTIWLAMEDEI